MSGLDATRIRRCCPAHHDWTTLARHLIADLDDAPINSIVDELAHAKQGAEFFELEQDDALDCAELIVRHRVRSASGPVHVPAARPAPIEVETVGDAQVAGARLTGARVA